MADQDDIDLALLSDEDLVLQMHEDLYDGLAEEIEEGGLKRRDSQAQEPEPSVEVQVRASPVGPPT